MRAGKTGELPLQDQAAGTCCEKRALAQSEQSFPVNPAPWQEKGICAELVTTGMGKGSRGGGAGGPALQKSPVNKH